MFIREPQESCYSKTRVKLIISLLEALSDSIMMISLCQANKFMKIWFWTNLYSKLESKI